MTAETEVIQSRAASEAVPSAEAVPLEIVIYIEQKEQNGEDAEPTALTHGEETGVLAVYDGMGGAGGSQIRTPEGESKTSAWYASRLVKQLLEEQFRAMPLAVREENCEPAGELQKILTETLATKAHEVEREPSRLRSSLIRRLPTTLAAVYYSSEFGAAGGAGYRIKAVWAGDSRAYLLEPASGLHQLTRDDVKSQGDAMANLLEDSPLSNCICADQPFSIHCQTTSVAAPFLLLTATDGCFGFLSTPAHFEHLLLSTLQAAANMEDWKQRIVEILERIAGDDATLALRALGWTAFTEMQSAFAERTRFLEQRFIREIDDTENRLHELVETGADESADRAELTEKRNSLRAATWQEYKPSYESYLHLETPAS